eukprot:750541-Hanusia_phi.AAC.4
MTSASPARSSQRATCPPCPTMGMTTGSPPAGPWEDGGLRKSKPEAAGWVLCSVLGPTCGILSFSCFPSSGTHRRHSQQVRERILRRFGLSGSVRAGRGKGGQEHRSIRRKDSLQQVVGSLVAGG